MKLLTIDTSTNTCSVALTDDDRIVAEYLLASEKPLSSRLVQMVDMVLDKAGFALSDLDGLGVALGPGAFTGLRVGVATVKGLALAAGREVAGFSSLAMLAMNLPWAGFPVCPMFDARKQEVYTALYRCRDYPEVLIDDGVIAPEAFLEHLEGQVVFVGEGAVRYRELIFATLGDRAIFAPSSAHQPRASVGSLLARQAFLDGKATPLALLSPSYVRLSEAELAKLRTNG